MSANRPHDVAIPHSDVEAWLYEHATTPLARDSQLPRTDRRRPRAAGEPRIATGKARARDFAGDGTSWADRRAEEIALARAQLRRELAASRQQHPWAQSALFPRRPACPSTK